MINRLHMHNLVISCFCKIMHGTVFMHVQVSESYKFVSHFAGGGGEEDFY